MKPIYTFEIASVNWSTQYLQCFSFRKRTWDLGPGPDHRPDPLMGCKNNIFFENFDIMKVLYAAGDTVK